MKCESYNWTICYCSFLASSGLMKCSQEPAGCTSSDKADDDGPNPIPDTTAEQRKLEDIR